MKHCILSLLALFISLTCLPASATSMNESTHSTIANTSEAKWNAQLASDMLYWLHKVLAEHQQVTKQEIDHFFAENANYQFGSKVLMHNDIDYWHEINNLATHTDAIKTHNNEIIAVKNKVVIWYDVNITLQNKQTVLMHIISIFTIKHHKILRWVKVINSKLLYG